MIINDFNLMRITTSPAEADAPLVVNADAVLPETITGELLEAIGRWDPQVDKAGGSVEHDKLAKCHPVKIAWQAADPLPAEETLGVLVAKTANHRQ